MSGRGRILPALVAIATGVVSGVYIFQPLILQERDKLITLNQSPNNVNNAPTNMNSATSRSDLQPAKTTLDSSSKKDS
ncbi:hypothetical protein RSOLAG1IB_05480 [Rhizoctonia solani AG-1 IB]|uniref:Uncharacterized protein n=1 Tax=Thanatephorus cucumeris (strain AG1-IB / isolate 7/3/14) TaxID=1108050 RepID=A0A0B7G3M4_THACB|nr:hypothetical protein RSOLAG1IB_05480 [Rhizoctonia solani AG-1 IB]